jgi:hypothetical protein
MKKHSGQKNWSEVMPVKFGQTSIRFWFFLSYVITTVKNLFILEFFDRNWYFVVLGPCSKNLLENSQNWKLSKLKVDRIESCQNLKLPELRIAKFKVAKIEVAKIEVAKIESCQN